MILKGSFRKFKKRRRRKRQDDVDSRCSDRRGCTFVGMRVKCDHKDFASSRHALQFDLSAAGRMRIKK